MIRLKKLTIMMATLAALALLAGTASAIDIPITNSGFESGAYSGFTSAYDYFTVPASPASGYGPGYGTGSYTKASLYDEGTFGVGTDPNLYHASWASFAPYEGNYMMIVNGATTGGTPVQVWASPAGADTIPVIFGQTYYFSAFVTSVYPPPVGTTATAPALLQFKINNDILVPNISTATTGHWDLFYAPWVADNTGFAHLSLLDLTTMASGNDYAIDKIRLTTEIPTVPEPATMLLFGLGLLGLAGVRRKLKK